MSVRPWMLECPRSVHAAAGHADVAQKQLHHGAGTHVLRTDRVLRPAEGVQDGHRLVLPAVDAIMSQIWRMLSAGVPQMRSTISTV